MRYGTTSLNLTTVPPGGTMSMLVGGKYIIELTGGTATQGYEQLETFLTLSNTIFRIEDVSTTYAAETSPYVSNPNDRLYADACLWENDPGSPNYRACLDGGFKSGGNPVVTTYTVTILSGGSPQALNSLFYDFSGSSFHYNSDFSASARFVSLIDPASVNIAKRFAPSTIGAGGTSTLVFTLTNSNSGPVLDYNFTDDLPSGMRVASTPAASTSGCGTPTFAPAANATSISFSGGTVAGLSSCTISVNVTVDSAGTYPNTTNHLFIGSVDTGHTASASLLVNTQPPPPSCVSSTLAAWDFSNTTDPAAPLPSLANVTASASRGAGTGNTRFLLPSTPNSVGTLGSWEMDSVLTGTSLTLSANEYFEFAIDTTRVESIALAFQTRRTQQGARNLQLYYGASPTNPSTVFTLIDQGTWFSFDSGTLTTNLNPTGLTYFRLYAYNATVTNTGHSIYLDGVTFTGCLTPQDPILTKAFTPETIAAGGTSTLTFTLNNPNSFTLTEVSFSDTLPAGMAVAGTPGAASTCGGTWAPSAGNTTLSFSNGSISARSSCTVRVNVTSSVAGPSTNISGFISSTQTGQNDGPGGSATATLTVLMPPQISKVFTPNLIVAGGVSTLTFTIVNPNQSYPINGVSFSDTFPTSPGAMVVASPPNASSTCGGTWSPSAGAASVSFSGGTIPAGGTCTLKVNVTAPVQGSYANTSGAVSHVVNSATVNGNTASATLTVGPAHPGIAIIKQIGLGSDQWYPYLAVAAGTSLYYRITIENVGDVPLNPVSVADPLVSLASCSWTQPLPVASALNDNHIASCIVGPVAAVAGVHPNTAQASGTYGATAYTDSASATYATTGLTLEKAASTTVYTATGDTIDYTFTVTNTGSATLSGPVTVSDSLIASVACPALSTTGNGNNFFESGEQIVCTASYTIADGDVAAGSVTNTANASAGGVTSPSDSVTIIWVPADSADLSITKTDSPDPVATGGTLTYTLSVTNAGPSAATNVVVTDTLPAGVTFGSATGTDWTCAEASSVVSCTRPALAVGAAPDITISVTAPASGGTITNGASVDATEPDPVPGNDSDTEDTTVSAAADLSIAKSDSPDPVVAGGTLTYTLAVTNFGPSSATNVVVTDTLPAGVTFGSATGTGWTCAEASGVVTCTRAALAVGTAPDITISVTAPTSSGTITNTASVDATEPDPVSSNDSDSEETTVTASADLSIAKSDSPDPVVAGGTLTYTLAVTNLGPSAATNVVVTDTLPTGVTFGSATGAGWTCAEASGVVSCTRAALAVGAAPDITISVTAPASGGTITNVASVDATEPDPVSGNDSDSEDTTVSASADLSIAKSDSPDPVVAGGTLTYTLQVSNLGPSDATNVVVTDTLPAGVTFGSATGTGWTCAEASGVVSCTRAALAVGTAPDITISVTAPASGGTITNAATVDATESDPVSGNDSDTEDTTVSASADLSIAKSDSPDPVVAGGTLTYTLQVSNLGPSGATNVVVTDTLPAFVTFGSATGTGWTCAEASGVVTCTRATLAVGAAPDITVSVTAPASGGTITNSASVDGTEPDPVSGNDSDTEDTTVSASADLSIAKSDSPDPVVAGGTLTYTLAVTNLGPSAATNVVVTDTLPAGVTFGSATGTGWTCAEASGVVTCTRAALAVGAAPDITVSVTAPASGGTITNSASVDATEPDPVSGNGSDSEDTTVNASSDLSITKSDSPDPIVAGGTLTYTLQVNNLGPSSATNVVVTDTLPAGVTFGSATGTGWTCAEASGVVSCTRAALAVGAAPDITVSVTAPASGGTITNTATVDATEPDPVSGNDSDTEDTTVGASADLSIAKSDSPDPVVAGGTLTYTLQVNNLGPSGATNVVVTDTLPAGVTFGSATGTGWTCAEASGVVSCTRAALAVGAAPDITVSVTAPASGGTITNTASVDATEPDPVSGNDSDSEDTVVGPSADLQITKTDGVTTYVPGASLTYTIVVSNPAGPSPVTAATVSDTFPAALTGVTWTCTGAGGVTCTATGSGNITDTVDIPVGGTLTYLVTAPVSLTATGPLSNTASVTLPAGITDPTPGNNSATDTDTTSTPAIGIAKQVSTPTDNGDGTYTVTYTLRVENLGGESLQAVQVSDSLTAEFGTYTTPPISAGQYTVTNVNTGSLTPNLTFDGASVTALLSGTDMLPVGTTVYALSFDVTFFPDLATSPFINQAIATGETGTPDGTPETIDLSNAGSDPDPNGSGDPTDPGENIPTSFVIGSAPVVEMAKTVQFTGDSNGNGSVDAGDELTYSVTLTNNGTAPAMVLAFTDTPDPNTQLIAGSVTVSVPATVTETTSVTVELASLNVGDSVQIQFRVAVNTPIPAGVTQVANQGFVLGSNVPLEPSDDPGTPTDDDPTVIALAVPPAAVPTAEPASTQALLLVFDPSISKVGVLQDGGVGLRGERLTWELSIFNAGTAAGTNVVVTDAINPDLRIDGASIDVGTYAISGRTVTFTIPVLNPGQTIRAYIHTTVLQSPLDVQNDAFLSGPGPDGAIVTRSAQARVTGVAILPDTGYPPVEEQPASWPGIVPVVLGLLSLGALVIRTWRRGPR